MKLIDILITLLFLISLIGCSETIEDRTYPLAANDRQGVPLSKDKFTAFPQTDRIGGMSKTTVRLPWELWPLSRDLNATRLTNASLLEGDELFRVGRKEEALKLYRHGLEISKSDAEKAAAIIRIASTELALDHPDQTLEILSQYFQKRQASESEVDERFSLIFAYAYGRKGDVDQSLAWFSKIYRLTAGLGPEADAAQRGVMLLARVFSNSKLLEVSKKWGADAFVSGLLGQESRRRSYDGFEEPTGALAQRFWEIETGAAEQSGMALNTSRIQVGVLLPLTGKYASLGKSTKQGVELAFVGHPAERGIVPVYKDTVGGVLEANAAFREIVALGKTPIVVGPLLSDVATAVSHIAIPEGVSLFALSKRSSFITGDGVFRLGPTLETQISSLINVAVEAKGLRNFAIIAPNTGQGDYYVNVFQEYAQRKNIQVQYTGRYNPGEDISLVNLVNQLQDVEVDAVFFPGALKEAARFLTNLPLYDRKRMKVLGLGTWDDAAQIKRSRTILEGIMFVSPYFAQSERDVVVKFNKAYLTKNGTPPDFLAAQGFDAATLVISALERGIANETPIVSALRHIESYEGLTGTMRVAPNGEVVRQFSVVELYHGKLREVILPDQAEQAPQDSYTMQGDTRL